MNLFDQRKAIVRAIIRGLKKEQEHLQQRGRNQPGFDVFFQTEKDQTDTCVATGLTFQDHMSETQIVWSDYGPIWIGLWLDDKLELDDAGDGNALFPHWLAEVLNEECGLDIRQEDIYVSSFGKHVSYTDDGQITMKTGGP